MNKMVVHIVVSPLCFLVRSLRPTAYATRIHSPGKYFRGKFTWPKLASPEFLTELSPMPSNKVPTAGKPLTLRLCASWIHSSLRPYWKSLLLLATFRDSGAMCSATRFVAPSARSIGRELRGPENASRPPGIASTLLVNR